jgi:hypothetical protein
LNLNRAARIALVVVAAAIVVSDLLPRTSAATTLVYTPSFRAFAFARLLLVGIVGLVAIQRTSSRRDALLFGGLLGLALEVFWQFVPLGPAFWAAALGSQLAVAFGLVQLVRYAIDAHPGARAVRLVTRLAIAFGCGVALAGMLLIGLGYGSWIDGTHLDDATFYAVAPVLGRARWFFVLAAALLMELAAVATLRANAADRPRALLVALGFAPMVATTSLHALVHVVTAHDAAAAFDADSLGYVATAAILTYGALARRLIDVEYAVISTVTGALLFTGVAAGAFAAEHLGVPLVERFIEHGVEGAHPELRTALSLAGAFVTFLGIGRFHERLNEAVRAIVFRRRDERVRRLERFASAEVWSTERGELARAIVRAVSEGADTPSVALYVRSGARYELLDGTAASAPHRVAATDSLVPPLRAPRRTAGGGLSLPMPLAETAYGFIWCGPRPAGTEFAADEIGALALVAREAGNALAAARSSVRPPAERGRHRRKRRPSRR